MTRTVLASATKEVVIGFDQPFCVIGERINPTGRKKLAAEMIAGNFDTVRNDALAQVAAGALVLDVNAGVTAVNPNETEPPLLVETIKIVQSLVSCPISINSSVPAALKAGLEVAVGRPLVNSVTGEEDRLEVDPAAHQEIQCPRHRHLQRRDRHFRRPRRALRGGEEDRRARRRLRHQARGHRGRPAGHADRRDGHRRPPGLHAGPPPARGAEGQYELRRLQHLLRPAAPARHQRRLPADGDRLGHDLGDHEPLPPAGDGGGARRQCADGHRQATARRGSAPTATMRPRAPAPPAPRRRTATRRAPQPKPAASAGGRRRGGREARRGQVG